MNPGDQLFAVNLRLKNNPMFLTSWITRLFQSRATKKGMNEFQTNEKPSTRAEGYRSGKELYDYLDHRFNAQIAGLVHFNCIRPNILALTELVKELNASLKNGDVLSAQRCYYTEELMSMSSFFQKDGYYIAHGKILDYLKVIEEFYTLTEVCEKANVGVHEHNYRMLTKVFESLKVVNLGLLEVLSNKD